jgi:hypothetical protein
MTISRENLAAFVWFVRLNMHLKDDSDEIARAFAAYSTLNEQLEDRP